MDDKIIQMMVDEAVEEALVRFGITTTEPVEMQKDFLYLRSLRETSQALKKKTWVTTVGVIVTSILAFIAMQLRSYFG